MAIGEAANSFFKAISGCLSGPVVSHGDADSGRSDQLLGITTEHGEFTMSPGGGERDKGENAHEWMWT